MARSTPGLLGLILTVLLVLGLATGAAGVADVTVRTARVADVADRGGPLAVAAQEIYHSLAEADATVAITFLSAEQEPVSLRQRYQTNLTEVSDLLVTVAARVPATGPSADAVAVLSVNLPVYTGLVETARVYNRQSLPLGAAYLREASWLMRDTLLPAARTLWLEETERMQQARQEATSVPWFALTVGALTLVALGAAQVFLTRRTRRLINPGLAAATVAILAAVTWLAVSWAGVVRHLEAGHQHGAVQVSYLAEARTAVASARASEALELIARSGGGEYEQEFTAAMEQLLGEDGYLARTLASLGGEDTSDNQIRQLVTLAVTIAEQWRDSHAEVRHLDDRGDYRGAVELATGTDDPASTGVLATRLDEHLASALEVASSTFTDESSAAMAALDGAAIAVGVLSGLAIAASAIGLQRRIAEYR